MASVAGTRPDINASWGMYDYKVRHELRAIRNGTKKQGTFKLILNREIELRTTLDNLEKTNEFCTFVEAVRNTVTTAGYHKGGASFWENAIGNALRQSDYYSNVATGRRVNSKVVLRRLLQALKPHDVTVTYLAPMEYVWMKKSRIACGTFTISKFTTEELDKILKSAVCKQFYPWAVANTGFLSSYWFLVVKEKRKLPSLGSINVDLGSIGRVTPKYSLYPKLEKALQRLAMYDWLPYWEDSDTSHKGKKKSNDWVGWLGFKIPFVIRVTSNILDRPERIPNLETLETEPCFDQVTNEEVGEVPSRYINLDEEQTQTLEQCLKTVDAMLSNIEPFLTRWSFIRIGLSFLVKGFFSKGLEQLLWHITALEALFGEDRPGLTQLMARRVALVLGETETQKKEISNHFEELYKLRSRLVHGSELKSEVWEGQLKVARDLTRRSLLWFLSFLVEFSKVGKCLPPEILAERKELLAVIDSRSGAIIQLAKILKSVSPSFPAVKAWQEPWALRW